MNRHIDRVGMGMTLLLVLVLVFVVVAWLASLGWLLPVAGIIGFIAAAYVVGWCVDRVAHHA